MPNEELYLKRLELTNFRKFGHLHVDFDEHLTVLIGDNGSGKTAILDAAAISLGALLIRVTSPYSAIDGRNIQSSDMRLLPVKTGSTISNQPQPVEIQADAMFRNREIRWSRTMNEGRRLGGTLKEATAVSQTLQDEITQGGQSVLPLLAYYGTGRLWFHKREKKYSEMVFSRGYSRSNGYIDCLDSANNEKLMLNWFERMTSLEIQGQQFGTGERLPELDAVRKALSLCFRDLTGTDKVTVIFDLKSNSLRLVEYDETGSSMLPFENLSDGYRNTLSLIADIAYRMAVLNPNAEDILSSPGVVLIDEIDLHLHPRWQERIIQDLTSIFPRVQFIVSSHAPSVVASVKAAKLRGIRPLHENEGVENIHGLAELSGVFDDAYTTYAPSDESYGHDAGDILEDVMNANERPVQVKRQIEEFHHALDDGKLDSAANKLADLERTVGPRDHDVVSGHVALDLERMDSDYVAD